MVTLINNQSNTIRVLGQNLETILPGLRFNQLNFELEWEGGTVEDHIFTTARSGIEHNGLPKATKLNVIDAIGAVARRFAYHPVQDYLNRLEWDGQPRLDDWLVRIDHTPRHALLPRRESPDSLDDGRPDDAARL